MSAAGIHPDVLRDLQVLDARNPGLVGQLVVRFIAQQEQLLADPRLQPESMDRGFIGDSAHRLKGSAGTLGASALAECARRLEELAACGAASEICQQLALLQAEVARASQLLQDAFGSAR